MTGPGPSTSTFSEAVRVFAGEAAWPLPVALSNTLTGGKDAFTPLNPPQVGMYACGVTVYDEAHLGHALQAVAFDVIRRFLEMAGYQVTYVRNYTDVDDKILRRAAERGMDPFALAQSLVDDTEEMTAALKVRPPDHAPRVTEHIADIIALIQRLEEKGFAYERDGSVYFAVEKFPEYGKLSHQDIDTLRDRLPEEYGKNDKVDFALWKRRQEGEGMFWPSPWGEGRPGWHIECSAMSQKYLGESFDIHGGGVDLVFPHHENEIAQSECATGKPYARFWLHNGLITVGGTKMSKSLGNFLTIRKALEKYPAVVLRHAMLDHHFASQADFGENVLLDATRRIYYFHRTLQGICQRLGVDFALHAPPDTHWPGAAHACFERFLKAMQDNINTAQGLVAMGEVMTQLNNLLSKPKWNESDEILAKALLGCAAAMNTVLDVLETPAALLDTLQYQLLQARHVTVEKVQELVTQRQSARASKDYAASDKLRDELLGLGIKVLDRKDGTSDWMLDPAGV